MDTGPSSALVKVGLLGLVDRLAGAYGLEGVHLVGVVHEGVSVGVLLGIDQEVRVEALLWQQVATSEGVDILTLLLEDSGTATRLDHPLDEHHVEGVTVGPVLDEAASRRAADAPAVLGQVPVDFDTGEVVHDCSCASMS